MSDVGQADDAIANSGDDGSITLRDLGLVVLMNIAWGGNFVVSKYAVTELPPVFSAAVRFAIVTVICLPWLKPLYGRMRQVLTLSLLLGFVQFAILFLALEMTEKVSGLAIIAQLGIPIAVLMAVVLLKERIGFWRIFGIALSFGGAILLGFDPEIFNDMDAVLTMLLSVIIMAYCAILMRNIRGVSPLEMQAWTGATSFVPLFILSALIETEKYDRISSATWVGWGAVVYSAIISSVMAHAINFYLLQRYPVSTVAPYSVLAPVIGVLSAVWFFGDALTLELILGGLLTLVGVMIVTLRSGIKKKQATSLDG